MMHCHKSVFLIRPLKEWELCYPEEIVLVLINQAKLSSEHETKCSKYIPYDFILVCCEKE